LEPGGLAVEWLGRGGHPSSYALLGGHVLNDGRGGFDIELAGPYVDSLARQLDDVEFGLPQEYLEGASRGLGSGVVITIAAHGRIGSSSVAFERVGRFLSASLRDGLPARDADVLDLWGSLIPGD
jgi:hypothetical protein